MADYAARGSQRWLQIAVEQHPEVLSRALRDMLGLASADTVEWRSPLRSDEFKEYRDSEALRKAGINKLPVRALNEFWPARGPVWDAIGVVSNGQPIFLEAKAHIAEAASPATHASPESLKLITKSLEEARKYYAPKATVGWTGTFYQYANRLAHHYFLTKVNGIRSHLVFLYFLNDKDMNGPASKEKWDGAIELLHAALGLTRFHAEGLHQVFIDVQAFARAASLP